MIRIAYLIDTFIGPTAGTENQLLRTIHRLDANRFETALFTLQHSPWLEQAQLPCPVTWVRFKSFYQLDFLRRREAFLAYCRQNRVDIVQSFFRDSNILGALWGRMAGVKVVIASRRNLGSGYWHNWMEVRILRFLSRLTTHYIANSHAAAEETRVVEGVSPERISVVPNLLNTASYRRPEARDPVRRSWGVPENALVVGVVANLRPIKNLDIFVRAAESVLERVPQAWFIILGEGPERPRLEQMIRSLNLQGRFSLPGVSTDVARDLQGLDVSVLCSAGESSPNALLESMAAAKPCVASDVGGSGELVIHGETGYLFPSGSAEALARSIVDLLENEEKRRAFGSRGQERAREHDETYVIPRLENLYESLVQSTSSPRVPLQIGV